MSENSKRKGGTKDKLNESSASEIDYIFNTVLCLYRFFRTDDANSVNTKVLSYGFTATILENAKNELIDALVKAKITTSVAKKNGKIKATIVKEIGTLFDDLAAKDTSDSWEFYPCLSDLGLLINKTPDSIKYDTLVKNMDTLGAKLATLTNTANQINDGLDSISKKSTAVQEQKKIQDKTKKKKTEQKPKPEKENQINEAEINENVCLFLMGMHCLNKQRNALN